MPLLTRPSARTTTTSAVLANVSARVRPEQVALTRAGIGAVMITRPRLLPGILGIDSATSARMGWSTQMLGVRELALGLGTFGALRSPDRRSARLWITAGMLCDAGDALAVGGALAKGRVAKVPAGAAMLSALMAVALGARSLGDSV